jgi:hypothetical protein
MISHFPREVGKRGKKILSQDDEHVEESDIIRITQTNQARLVAVHDSTSTGRVTRSLNERRFRCRGQDWGHLRGEVPRRYGVSWMNLVYLHPEVGSEEQQVSSHGGWAVHQQAPSGVESSRCRRAEKFVDSILWGA